MLGTQPPSSQKGEMPSEDQIGEIREIFTLFDKDSDGLVGVTELGSMLRALNLNPTESEVENLKNEIDSGRTGSFDQNSFLTTVVKRGKDSDTIEDLVEAFTVMGDNVEGTEPPKKIRVERWDYNYFNNRFKLFVCNKGEAMEESEVEEILMDCDVVDNDGFVNIEEFAKIIMSR